MSIKDNFSQAVKELWKKDGQSEQGVSSSPSELERYLKQQSSEQTAAGDTVTQPMQSAAPAQQSSEGDRFQQSAQNTQSPQPPSAQDSPTVPLQQPMNNMQQNPGQNRAMDGYNRQSGYGGAGQGYGNPAQSYANAAQNFGGYDSSGGFRQPPPLGGGVPSYSQGSGAGFGGYVPPVPGENLPQQPGETDEVTVISKNTIIDGNVRSLANMQIDGNIKGNVETTRNVDMTGKIVGDITCNNAGMAAAAMQGNVSLKGRIRMDRDTILIGDLSSQYADINGRIRGKLDIAGKAELKRDAIVFGDINASTIAVTDGAIIQGYVNTTFLSKEDSRNAIPEAISIDSKDGGAGNT